MALKRALPFFVMILALTGCFRQANDEFDTVDSQSDDEAATMVIPPTETEMSPITIIAPDDNTQMPDTDSTTSAADAQGAATEVETATPVRSTNTTAPTSTNPPPPDEDDTDNLSTATEASFITPEAPGQQLDIDTATSTPTPRPTRESDGQVSSAASDEDEGDGEAEEESTPTACEYVVQSGDNAYRIALNNNVSLNALLTANDLSANPIIQPGQRLILPDCEADASATAEDEMSDAEATETVDLEPGYRLHVVVAGDTLAAIAQRYGVTVDAIVEANDDITNPNQISQGQEVLIPPEEE
jgi:LysM repeat protein